MCFFLPISSRISEFGDFEGRMPEALAAIYPARLILFFVFRFWYIFGILLRRSWNVIAFLRRAGICLIKCRLGTGKRWL